MARHRRFMFNNRDVSFVKIIFSVLSLQVRVRPHRAFYSAWQTRKYCKLRLTEMAASKQHILNITTSCIILLFVLCFGENFKGNVSK